MSVSKEVGSVRYVSRRIMAPDVHLNATTRLESSTTELAKIGTLEYFLCERYLLYTGGMNGKLLKGQVFHEPYPLNRATTEIHSQTITDPVVSSLGAPDHVLFSPGVDVSVYPLQKAE